MNIIYVVYAVKDRETQELRELSWHHLWYVAQRRAIEHTLATREDTLITQDHVTLYRGRVKENHESFDRIAYTYEDVKSTQDFVERHNPAFDPTDVDAYKPAELRDDERRADEEYRESFREDIW